MEDFSVVADQFQEAERRNPESCQSVVAAAGATQVYNRQDVELTPGAWNATHIDGTGCSFELRITTWSDFVGTFYIDDVSN